MKNLYITIISLGALGALGCGDSETSPFSTATGGAGAGGATGGGGTTVTIGVGGSGGGSGGAGATGGNGGSGGIPMGAPGELTIDVVDLAGAAGKTVIVSVFEGDVKVGGICARLMGEPANASEVVGAVAGDPCVVGDAVQLSGGLTTLRGGLYSTGTPAPEMCLAQNVVVDGDTTVTLGAFQSCQ